MKTLHLVKTRPDNNTKTFIDVFSEGKEATVFNLYEPQTDYDELLDLIFEHDKIISWW
jgi:hypothetical protein